MLSMWFFKVILHDYAYHMEFEKYLLETPSMKIRKDFCHHSNQIWKYDKISFAIDVIDFHFQEIKE